MIVEDDAVLIRKHTDRQKAQGTGNSNDSPKDHQTEDKKNKLTDCFSSQVNSDQTQKLPLVGVIPVASKIFQIIAKNHDCHTYRIYLNKESVAARVADRCAIQRSGLRAKTNFNYSRQELCRILTDIRNDTDQNILLDRFVVTFKSYLPPELKEA